jgi:hypothetical protein
MQKRVYTNCGSQASFFFDAAAILVDKAATIFD